MAQQFDICVIGGGIVGVATALSLQQKYPHQNILLLEKEKHLAKHQTGRNSGVVHAGIYYEPNSLKADFCKRGLTATKNFCQQENLPYINTGKLIVASNTKELAGLKNLFERSRIHQLNTEWLDQTALTKKEPNIKGLAAIWVKDTAITNYTAITERMAEHFKKAGGTLLYEQALKSVEETESHISITTQNKTFETQWLVSCAGLQADRICQLFNIPCDFKIIPFKGEYYYLAKEQHNIVKHLIYPVPNPALPFLGIHLTPMIDGSITVGPNALLSWKREAYGTFNIDWRDTWATLSFIGFWRLAKTYITSGIIELRNSLFKPFYLKAVKKYCPSLTLKELQAYPSGVRAQAVDNNGKLIHDFLFAESKRSLHVCNAPSPAATSAKPIGEHITKKLEEKINAKQ